MKKLLTILLSTTIGLTGFAQTEEDSPIQDDIYDFEVVAIHDLDNDYTLTEYTDPVIIQLEFMKYEQNNPVIDIYIINEDEIEELLHSFSSPSLYIKLITFKVLNDGIRNLYIIGDDEYIYSKILEYYVEDYSYWYYDGTKEKIKTL
mgnify:CR=1 FL=1